MKYKYAPYGKLDKFVVYQPWMYLPQPLILKYKCGLLKIYAEDILKIYSEEGLIGDL